jgi:ABC-type uncharacterized transport system permease subunit
VIDAIYALAVAAYAIASALLVIDLVGKDRRPGHTGVVVLLVAAVLHIVHDALRWSTLHVGPLDGIGPVLSSIGLLAVLLFLLVRQLRPSTEIVGAFVTPIALLMLLGSRAPDHDTPTFGPWISAHIISNVLGMTAFTVSAAMAVAYLIQERQVKARRLGRLFHRLPPLEVLDTLAFRFIVLGMPALTVGVITGHVLAARSVRPQGLPWQQYFAIVAWLVFAGVLFLRGVAGWRGRRAAIGTILGYASAALVLLFYTVRGGTA